MALSSLPLSYCTNVHPAGSIEQVRANLLQHAVPIARQLGGPLAVGLWLNHAVAEQLLQSPGEIDRLADLLAEHALCCYTLNAFPFGAFHGQPVKHAVYLPDWSDPRRLRYTQQCAQILARLCPRGVVGSISTLPLGFKCGDLPADFQQTCARQLIDCCRFLHQLHEQSGVAIQLAMEPEPLCVLETTAEAIAFFTLLRQSAAAADALPAVERHMGLCVDACHQAVEFEDPAAAVAALQRAKIPIAKVHLSSAICLPSPATSAAGRKFLSDFAEPYYLHQVLAHLPDGRILRQDDLSRDFAASPPADFAAADEWRIHFHVPIHRPNIGLLPTTQHQLQQTLVAVAQLPDAPHLEVETYTWGVLPQTDAASLNAGIAAELTFAAELIAKPV